MIYWTPCLVFLCLVFLFLSPYGRNSGYHGREVVCTQFFVRDVTIVVPLYRAACGCLMEFAGLLKSIRGDCVSGLDSHDHFLDDHDHTYHECFVNSSQALP